MNFARALRRRSWRDLVWLGRIGIGPAAYCNNYDLTVTAGTTSGFVQVARYVEDNRRQIILRNPAGSPGNIVVGTRPGTDNPAINVGSFTTTLATLAPGEEWIEEGTSQILMARSDLAAGSVPAGLILEVEVDVAR